MYSSSMLHSDTSFGVHPLQGPYPAFAPRPVSPRDRYYHALAGVRSAELEILEAERARREERFLQQRLQELRQARIERLRRDTLGFPYGIHNTPFESLSYNRSRSETSRLWLQEQLFRSEALHSNLLQLEERRLQAVGEQYNDFRGMLSLEQAGLLHKLGVSEQADISYPSLFVTNRASVPFAPSDGIPARSFNGNLDIKHSDSWKELNQLDDLVTHLDAQRLRFVTHPVDQTGRESKASFQSHKSRQNQPPIASTQTDLDRVLGQSGFFAFNNPCKEKSIHRTGDTNEREKFPRIQRQDVVQRQAFSKAESSKQEKHEKRSSQASPQLDTTLRERLKRRLGIEHEDEVRDTIEAILNSLWDMRSAPAGAEASSTPTIRPSAKGKEKEHTPSLLFEKLSTSKVADAPWLQVQEIEKQFHALEREFEFPNKLDFISSIPTRAGSTPATSYLSFKASNQPIHFFEQSLGQLLIKLDLIESHGNEELRNKRKDVVHKVEKALEDLEREVEERLKAKLTSDSKRRSVTIEDVTAPDEHLGAKVAPSSSWVAEKTDSTNNHPHPTPSDVGETAETLSSSSTQVPIGGLAILNVVAEEPVHQGLGGQESIATDSRVQEAVLGITVPDVLLSRTHAGSPASTAIPLELESSESEEEHASEDWDSNPNTTTSLESAERPQAIDQEYRPTESDTGAAATVIVGVPASAGSDTQAQNETSEIKRNELSDEETSDVFDVESASSDWSEVDEAVAR